MGQLDSRAPSCNWPTTAAAHSTSCPLSASQPPISLQRTHGTHLMIISRAEFGGSGLKLMCLELCTWRDSIVSRRIGAVGFARIQFLLPLPHPLSPSFLYYYYQYNYQSDANDPIDSAIQAQDIGPCNSSDHLFNFVSPLPHHARSWCLQFHLHGNTICPVKLLRFRLHHSLSQRRAHSLARCTNW